MSVRAATIDGMENPVLVQVTGAPAVPVEAAAITFAFHEPLRPAGTCEAGAKAVADDGALTFPVEHSVVQAALSTGAVVTATAYANDSGQRVSVTGEATMVLTAGEDAVMMGAVRGDVCVVFLNSEPDDLALRVSPVT